MVFRIIDENKTIPNNNQSSFILRTSVYRSFQNIKPRFIISITFPIVFVSIDSIWFWELPRIWKIQTRFGNGALFFGTTYIVTLSDPYLDQGKSILCFPRP